MIILPILDALDLISMSKTSGVGFGGKLEKEKNQYKDKEEDRSTE